MKFILLAFVMNITNPSDPSMFLHKTFPSKAACEYAVKQMPQAPSNLRAAYFCVSEDDLLDIKNHA